MLAKTQITLAKFSVYTSWERIIIMSLISFSCPEFIILNNEKVQITSEIFKHCLRGKTKMYLKVSIRLLDFHFLGLGRLLPGFQDLTVVSRHLLV